MDAVEVIRDAADRFAAALAATPAQQRVPTCPDWSAADLLWHLTEVHHFWAAILADGVRDEAGIDAVEAGKPERPEDMAELLRLRAVATARLLAALPGHGDDERRWTWWTPDQTVGFIRRMQICEATMHRVDAELTAGTKVSAISEPVATLAVSHAVDVMWSWLPEWGRYAASDVVEFVASDSGARWLIEIGGWRGVDPESGREFDEPRAVRATGGLPAASVSGAVADLALWTWTRGGDVEIAGAPAACAALHRLRDAGMG